MKKYKVHITEQAEEQLWHIREYISHELLEKETSKKILKLLRESMESLVQFPQRARCIDEQPLGSFGVRKIPVKNYYVYYWIDEEGCIVHVIAVVYSKRDQAAQLEQITIV